MKIFISSIISGMEPFRAAARCAVEQLGHIAVMAEDFGAKPSSPQIACLEGLRGSALTILIIGEKYGAKQRSGHSATHEEFLEARDRRPILAFLQEGIARDADQENFVKEVGTWEAGLFRESFTTPEQLKTLVTKRVHQWELAAAAGPVDNEEMLQRAMALLPDTSRQRNQSGNTIALALAAGPRQPLLRPAQLESATFKTNLQKAALFGKFAIFDSEQGTRAHIRDHALILSQEQGPRLAINGEGSLSLRLPLKSKDRFGGANVIEEDVLELIKRALAFAMDIWDQIDSTQRISQGAIACLLSTGGGGAWRTRAEQAANPSSYTMNMSNENTAAIHLNPAARNRSSISHQIDDMSDDLLTLMKRQALDSRWP